MKSLLILSLGNSKASVCHHLLTSLRGYLPLKLLAMMSVLMCHLCHLVPSHFHLVCLLMPFHVHLMCHPLLIHVIHAMGHHVQSRKFQNLFTITVNRFWLYPHSHHTHGIHLVFHIVRHVVGHTIHHAVRHQNWAHDRMLDRTLDRTYYRTHHRTHQLMLTSRQSHHRCF